MPALNTPLHETGEVDLRKKKFNMIPGNLGKSVEVHKNVLATDLSSIQSGSVDYQKEQVKPVKIGSAYVGTDYFDQNVMKITDFGTPKNGAEFEPGAINLDSPRTGKDVLD